jgi:glycosyltransferase involved in cell wall biosynthesis
MKGISMSKRKLSKTTGKKIKVLAYADSPTSATGFSTVSRNIFEALYKTGRYEIDILGINYWGDPHNFPYKIWPAGINNDRDPYGRKKVANMIQQMEYDILFFLQDTFILDFMPPLISKLKDSGKKFKSIVYYPIDGFPKEQWIKNVSCADYMVAYTKFGADLSKLVYSGCKDPLVIPHGANVSDYKPLPKEDIAKFRKMYFGHHHDKFIVTNINRNQHRKDIPRTIMAFKEFRKKVPDSILYLHMAPKDQGWNLLETIKSFGFTMNNDVVFPENFGPNQGYPREVVNLIYNSSDLVVSTSLGEGWGLSWVEAMSTKTPILMPNNTSMKEHITDEIGYTCKSGGHPSLYTVLPHDNEVIRPLVDVEDMVNKMVHIYNNYDEALGKAEKAYKMIHDKFNWQGAVGDQWIELFNKVYYEGLKEAVGSTGTEEKTIDVEEF